jgi:hypothetical protein
VCVNCASTDLWGAWVGDHPGLPGGNPLSLPIVVTDVSRSDMPRRRRIEFEGAIYDIMARGNARLKGSPQLSDDLAEIVRLASTPAAGICSADVMRTEISRESGRAKTTKA